MTNNDDSSDIDDVMDDYDRDADDLDIGAGPILSRTYRGRSPLMKMVLPAVAFVAVSGAVGFYFLGAKQSAPEYVVQVTDSKAPETQVADSTAQPPQPVAFTSEVPTPPIQEPEPPVDQLGKLENEVLASNDIPRGPEDVTPAESQVDQSPETADASTLESGVTDSVVNDAKEPSSEAVVQPQILGASESAVEQPPVPDVVAVAETSAVPPPMPKPVPVVIDTPPSPTMPIPPADMATDQNVEPLAAVAPILGESVTGDSSMTEIDQSLASGGPDNYYDSRLNVPTGPLANSVGPRKVDPVQEPASRFVIANKTFDGSDVEAQVVAANRALDLGRYESALEMFEQLYKRNDRDPRILMGRAISQQKLGLDDQAIMSYEALLELAPENTNAIVNLMGLIQRQYPSIAQRRLLDLQAKYPGNAGIAAQLGMTFAQMGDNNEAMRSLGMAASLEPRNASHLYNMAVITDRMGNTAQAINYYQQTLEVDAVYGGGRSVPRATIYDRLARLRAR